MSGVGVLSLLQLNRLGPRTVGVVVAGVAADVVTDRMDRWRWSGHLLENRRHRRSTSPAHSPRRAAAASLYMVKRRPGNCSVSVVAPPPPPPVPPKATTRTVSAIRNSDPVLCSFYPPTSSSPSGSLSLSPSVSSFFVHLTVICKSAFNNSGLVPFSQLFLLGTIGMRMCSMSNVDFYINELTTTRWSVRPDTISVAITYFLLTWCLLKTIAKTFIFFHES